MDDILSVLQSMPAPIILALLGVLFILVSVFGLSKMRRVWGSLIGLLLLAVAILLIVIPTSPGVEEVIQIFSPEPNTTVTSPVSVAGFGGPAFEATLVIEVYGEDGEVVGQGNAILQVDEMSERGPFAAQVDFSVERLQPGRISVFIVSPRDGGIEHLSSVNVSLSP